MNQSQLHCQHCISPANTVPGTFTTELTKCRFTGADRTTHRLNIVSNKIIPTNKIIWHELYVQQISAYEKHSFNGNFTGKSNYTKTTKIHDISFIFLIIQVIKIRRNMNENPTQKVYLYFCNHYLPWLIFLNYITLCYNIQIFNPWVVRSAPVNLHFVSSVVCSSRLLERFFGMFCRKILK